MREVRPFEPWFFILFGLFHLHRVWGLLDRESYAAFWLGVLTERGVFYWTLMAALGGMCLLALALFFRCFRERCWWRWVYLFGGGYVLFDLFAIKGECDANTISGWVMERIGKVPEEGDHFVSDGLDVTVTRVDHRRALEIRVEVLPPAAESADKGKEKPAAEKGKEKSQDKGKEKNHE